MSLRGLRSIAGGLAAGWLLWGIVPCAVSLASYTHHPNLWQHKSFSRRYRLTNQKQQSARLIQQAAQREMQVASTANAHPQLKTVTSLSEPNQQDDTQFGQWLGQSISPYYLTELFFYLASLDDGSLSAFTHVTKGTLGLFKRWQTTAEGRRALALYGKYRHTPIVPSPDQWSLLNGEPVKPQLVTIDSAGTMYIATSSGTLARIQKGLPGQPCAQLEHCYTWPQGSQISAITTDQQGNVHVIVNDFVYRFSANAAAIKLTSKHNLGNRDSNSGELIQLTSIATTKSGDTIFIADSQKMRIIQRHDGQNSVFLDFEPFSCSKQRPLSLVIDSKRNLLTAYHGRILKIAIDSSSTHTDLYQLADEISLSHRVHLALDAHGNLYALHQGVDQSAYIYQLTPAGRISEVATLRLANTEGSFTWQSLAVDPTDSSLYVIASAQTGHTALYKLELRFPSSPQ